MSRSRRRVPITGITTTASDKKWKRAARKGFRRQWKSGKDVQSKYEVGDEFGWGKDGKMYHRDADAKLLRK